MNFKKITLEDRNSLNHYLKDNAEGSCELTFINLMVWQVIYGNSYCILDDMLFLRSGEEGNYLYSLPFCKDMKKAIDYLYSHTAPKKPHFWAQEGERLERFKKDFSNEYIFEEERDAFDYIYLTEDLSKLSGKKYHSKRNHISSFSKKVDWEYKTITKEMLKDVKLCADRWYSENLHDSDRTMLCEKNGLFKILDNMDLLNAKGGSIWVNGQVVAFTIGSKINSEIFDIHIEKALSDYAEAYTVINREFARNELKEYKYINREDDMGIAGLRKAKLSYKPFKLLKKYICSPKRLTEDKLKQCRKIYNEAFGVSEDFDNGLFTAFENNIETLEINGKIVSMLFKLPCKIINGAVTTDAFYIYAAATDKNERNKGYMRELLNNTYGDGTAILILKPQSESLQTFYSQMGFFTAWATPSPSDNFKIEVSENHQRLSTQCDKPSDTFVIMYRFSRKVEINGISFSQTLE